MECIFNNNGLCTFKANPQVCSLRTNKVCLVWLTQPYEWTEKGYVPIREERKDA